MTQTHSKRDRQTAATRPGALLVGLQLASETDQEHDSSMAELSRLVHTLGYEVVGVVSQKRRFPAAGSVVGEGKLKEIALFTGGSGVVRRYGDKPQDQEDDEDGGVVAPYGDFGDEQESGFDSDTPCATKKPGDAKKAEIVVFDNELTPTQLRNLETALDVEVLDRTGVIVEIFHRHAKTREARLQVEIARLRYLAPRLRMMRGRTERQGGGIGAKGVGETAHELDKRRIRDRVAELQHELTGIHKSQGNRRARRQEQAKVALVGYTNAGKSSLMRALTGSDVLVEDKLFATLDTTIRAMQPETNPRVLISDTVGFIKKLPHDLVASFRSTLDEAGDASLLLFVVDASDPSFRTQLAVTKEVLAEIGVADIPSRLILNKMDQLTPAEETSLQEEFPEAIRLSTRRPDDIKTMHALIQEFFEAGMEDAELSIPYTHSALIGDVRRSARVLHEEHTNEGTILKIRAPLDVLNRLKKKL